MCVNPIETVVTLNVSLYLPAMQLLDTEVDVRFEVESTVSTPKVPNESKFRVLPASSSPVKVTENLVVKVMLFVRETKFEMENTLDDPNITARADEMSPTDVGTAGIQLETNVTCASDV
jgi:hypothetical protein